jgi:hypothetical protein
MSILLNDNLNVKRTLPIDARYGPWGSKQTALDNIPDFQRYKGLTVGILVDQKVVEYWFESAFETVDDLVLKTSSGGAGADGASGATGATGVMGATGATGETGLIGPTGVSGATGLVGPTGVSGATGVEGPTGVSGATGVEGPTGATGQTGLTGVSGATGIQGVSGVSGATGPKGDTGLGFSVFTTGDTLAELSSVATNANIGQFGLVKGGELYVYRGSGLGATGPLNAYDFVSDITTESLLIGATGETGLQGVSGPSGATGVEGPTGVSGATGLVGVSGATGIEGPTGVSGATGLIGPTGVSGATGVEGPTGVSGATGLVGPTGVSGATGVEGPTGVSGATGVEGPTGVSGATGLIGPTGVSGATGVEGPTGVSGATGIAGPTGVSGATGVEGPTGVSGATGVAGPTGASGVSDRYQTSFTGTLTVVEGPLTATLESGLSYSINQDITISHSTDTGIHMHGYVVSYNKSTGELAAQVVTHSGSGSVAATWVVNLDGAVGAIGPTGATGAIGGTGPSGASGATGPGAATSLFVTGATGTVTNVPVGGATAPVTAAVWGTKTISEILDAILFPDQLPTYTIPTITFDSSVEGNAEIGSTINPVLALTATENDAGAFSAFRFYRGATLLDTVTGATGVATSNIQDQYGYTDPNNPNLQYTVQYTDTFTVTAGNTNWTAQGDCAAGLPKKNNKGVTDTTAAGNTTGTPQAARTITSAADTVTGIYPYFYGKVSPSGSQIIAANVASYILNGTGGSTKVVAPATGTVTVTFNATGHYLWLAIPSTSGPKVRWYNTDNNTGLIGDDGSLFYRHANVAISAPTSENYWQNVDYDIYISSGVTLTSGSHQFRSS